MRRGILEDKRGGHDYYEDEEDPAGGTFSFLTLFLWIPLAIIVVLGFFILLLVLYFLIVNSFGPEVQKALIAMGFETNVLVFIEKSIIFFLAGFAGGFIWLFTINRFLGKRKGIYWNVVKSGYLAFLDRISSNPGKGSIIFGIIYTILMFIPLLNQFLKGITFAWIGYLAANLAELILKGIPFIEQGGIFLADVIGTTFALAMFLLVVTFAPIFIKWVFNKITDILIGILNPNPNTLLGRIREARRQARAKQKAEYIKLGIDVLSGAGQKAVGEGNKSRGFFGRLIGFILGEWEK